MRRTTSGGAFPYDQQDSENKDSFNASSEPNPLTRRLNDFRLQEIGCDVAFVVGEEMEKLKAHKLVLGASSPVFLAMFYGPLASDSSPTSLRIINPAVNVENLIGKQQESTSGAISISTLQHNQPKTAHIVSSEIPPPQPPHFHRQISHPFEGGSIVKRRFSISKPKNLGHRTVQSQGEQQQQLNFDENSMKIELAVKGLQMVRVPDCEPKAFAILIDFVYSDFDINNLSRRNLLNEENVMNTLYAAKKYDIHPLVTECVRYCTARLTATNAVSLLAQARLLDENTLVEQCYQVIDQNTDIALHANAIADIDRDTLINVLGRNQLDPSSELIIFHAAKAWAEAECSRKHIQPTVENLRKCLGPAMELIRFSLMDVNEFGQAASSSLLTYEEIAEVFLHLTVRPRPPCRFACKGFRANSRSKHVVQRFLSVSAKPRSRREYKVCFTVDRNVLISGLSVYGVFQSNNK
uniref:BTB domain-containing protein n=1 Tax=Meloidogyne javanica TaxID=6303 RepID=A0A915LK86_MELJA